MGCVAAQRAKSMQVSWECQEELFRQEVENADDIRLSYRLLKKCMGDKKKFCADVKPGMPLCQVLDHSSRPGIRCVKAPGYIPAVSRALCASRRTA